eukprot:330937-Chlamydomonas_euryale.AAC.8
MYPELTSRRVLTMEFIDAVSVADSTAVRAAGHDAGKLASLISETFSEMIFVHGHVHCDPHAANLMVRFDERRRGWGHAPRPPQPCVHVSPSSPLSLLPASLVPRRHPSLPPSLARPACAAWPHATRPAGPRAVQASHRRVPAAVRIAVAQPHSGGRGRHPAAQPGNEHGRERRAALHNNADAAPVGVGRTRQPRPPRRAAVGGAPRQDAAGECGVTWARA